MCGHNLKQVTMCFRMKRFNMKAWSINVSREKKQREAIKNDLEAVNITVESVPLSFLTWHSCEQIRPTPFACVTDFASVVFHLLEEKGRLGQLTWHDGVIPQTKYGLSKVVTKGGIIYKDVLAN
uniref:Uncharacterized protein n=1 Tax=Amphimedon queenslandica TaxID=400682 RepID=A0A1X7U184_AMPQE